MGDSQVEGQLQFSVISSTAEKARRAPDSALEGDQGRCLLGNSDAKGERMEHWRQRDHLYKCLNMRGSMKQGGGNRSLRIL